MKSLIHVRTYPFPCSILVLRPAAAHCPRNVSIGAKLGTMQVAERCLHSANDLSGLLLLTSARGDVAGLRALVESAEGAGRLNVAFLARFLLGDLTECVSPPSIWHHYGERPTKCKFRIQYSLSICVLPNSSSHCALLEAACLVLPAGRGSIAAAFG